MPHLKKIVGKKKQEKNTIIVLSFVRTFKSIFFFAMPKSHLNNPNKLK